MLTKTLAIKLSRFGVAANAIAPRVLLTDLSRDFSPAAGAGERY